MDSDIPVLIGSNANEGFLFLMTMYLPDIMPYSRELTAQEKNLTDEAYRAAIGRVYSYFPEVASTVAII